MTEEIISALAWIEGYLVTARMSSSIFQIQQKGVRYIGNELGVSLAPEGSFRKQEAHTINQDILGRIDFHQMKFLNKLLLTSLLIEHLLEAFELSRGKL
ncbi:MAG: hypothetical protein AAF391_14240 [Bacteroidota bacterium]